jgi:hypothetical protein
MKTADATTQYYNSARLPARMTEVGEVYSFREGCLPLIGSSESLSDDFEYFTTRRSVHFD